MGEVSCEGGLGPRSHLDQRTNRCSGDKRQVGSMACGRKQRNAAISLNSHSDGIPHPVPLRTSAYVGDHLGTNNSPGNHYSETNLFDRPTLEQTDGLRTHLGDVGRDNMMLNRTYRYDRG